MADTDPVKPVQEPGPIGALAASKKYGITAVVVGSAIGLTTKTALNGDFVSAVAFLGIAGKLVAWYVVGQAAIDCVKVWKK